MARGQHAISIVRAFGQLARQPLRARLLVMLLFGLSAAPGSIAQEAPALTAELLSSYVASKQVATLKTDITFNPTAWTQRPAPSVDDNMVMAYAATQFVPTSQRVENARKERLCLAQALYHEARGEPESGQWAVANVILNRVASHLYPSTICGVVFQNAGGKKFRCQFTFACDGRSDMGGNGNRIVRESWVRSNLIAHAAFRQFQNGKRPDTLPGSALYYHTRSVSPAWSRTYRQVARIGAHIFYARS